MFDSGSSPKKEKLIAVADVGGGGAAVALVRLDSDGSATMLAEKRLMLPIESRTPEQEIGGVVALLSQAAEETIKSYAGNHGGASPASVAAVYAIIHAPWVRSSTMHADSGFSSEERITARVLSGLVHQALGAQQQADVPELLRSGSIHAELNGYPTRRPLGKSAHMAAVSVLVSECESSVQSGGVEALRRSFSMTPMLRPRERALISILDGSARERDQIVVGVSSAATDIVVVRRDTAADRAVVPEGSRTILARASAGGLPEEAFSLMSMIARDACTSEACMAFQTALARAEPELVRVFGETMAGLAGTRRLPNTLILVAEPEMAPWLAQFFSRLDFGQFTVTTKPFSVSVLSPADLSTRITNASEGAVDAGLALAAHCATMEERYE